MEAYDDYEAVRVLKKQEETLWCGYAVAEAMLRLGGKDVTQGFLADDMIDQSSNVYRTLYGNISSEEIIKLIKSHDCNVLDVSVGGQYAEENLEQVIKEHRFAIVGSHKHISNPGSRKDIGYHWQLVEYIESAEDGKNLLVHDPLFGMQEDGMMVPKRYSLKAFCNKKDKECNWNIITLSEDDVRISKDENNNVVQYDINGQNQLEPQPTEEQLVTDEN